MHKTVSGLRDWLKKYWLALLVSMNFLIVGLIFSYPIPYNHSYFQYVGNRLPIELGLLGPLFLPSRLLYQVILLAPHEYLYPDFWAFVLIDSNRRLVSIVLCLLTSCLIGLVTWCLLKTNKTRKLTRRLLIINYVLAIVFVVLGLLINPNMNFRDTLYSAKNDCVFSVSNSSIRVINFHSRKPSEMGLSGIPRWREVAYLIKDNDSEQWREFMHILLPQRTGQCDQIRELNKDFIWLWEYKMLVISEDGGKMWRVWDVSQIPKTENSGNSDNGRVDIVDVKFANELNGEMWLHYPEYSKQILPAFHLVTADGGLTWTFIDL